MRHVPPIILGVAATLAVASAVTNAIDGDWITASWALTAAVAETALALTLVSALRPRPFEDRGVVVIAFTGGPLDGARIPVDHGPSPDLNGLELELNGTRYRVGTPDHTCYSAEVQT